MTYVYKSPIGKMTIQKSPKPGNYVLYIEKLENLSTISDSPERLAELVYNFALCIPDWDDFTGKITNVPQTLSQWERIPD